MGEDGRSRSGSLCHPTLETPNFLTFLPGTAGEFGGKMSDLVASMHWARSAKSWQCKCASNSFGIPPTFETLYIAESATGISIMALYSSLEKHLLESHSDSFKNKGYRYPVHDCSPCVLSECQTIDSSNSDFEFNFNGSWTSVEVKEKNCKRRARLWMSHLKKNVWTKAGILSQRPQRLQPLEI